MFHTRHVNLSPVQLQGLLLNFKELNCAMLNAIFLFSNTLQRRRNSLDKAMG